MKIRTGFVSNSSSSSFIINASEFSLDKIKNFIEELVSAYNELKDENYSVDSICTIYESNVEEFNKLIKRRGYEDYSGYVCEDGATKVIRIDSTHDNSIPYLIDSALDSICIRRQHWG